MTRKPDPKPGPAPEFMPEFIMSPWGLFLPSRPKGPAKDVQYLPESYRRLGSGGSPPYIVTAGSGRGAAQISPEMCR